MKSQTARRADNQRAARSAKPKKYVKQTAHVEARRDGKPLIFGWGGHLSRSEKTRLQRRAVWFSTIAVAIIIVLIIVGFWVNLNIITPNLPITTVNGVSVPQSDYRKLVAVNTQLELNKLYGPHGLTAQRDSLKKQSDDAQKTANTLSTQVDNLNKQIKALPPGPSAQRTKLNNQLTTAKAQLNTAQNQYNTLFAEYETMVQSTIPNEQQLFTQSQVGNDSAQWLQDDVVIRQWLAKQSASLQAKITPTTSAIDQQLQSFKANMPSTTSYSKFLSQDNLSDADVRAMLALSLRRNNMQSYLASQITSPEYQVHVRAMTISTLSQAQKVLDQLKHGGNFGQLAAKYSVDTNSNKKGGDLGWLARYQYIQQYAANSAAVVDNWIFVQHHTINELSPILNENGTYHIVQILDVDPSRAVDSSTLQSLKSNALIAWLLSQKAMPGMNITAINQTRIFDASNMPSDLPQAAPATTPTTGGLPGGIPGSGVPGSSGSSGQP